jgi:hypothetical protein
MICRRLRGGCPVKRKPKRNGKVKGKQTVKILPPPPKKEEPAISKIQTIITTTIKPLDLPIINFEPIVYVPPNDTRCTFSVLSKLNFYWGVWVDWQDNLTLIDEGDYRVNRAVKLKNKWMMDEECEWKLKYESEDCGKEVHNSHMKKNAMQYFG